MTQACCISLMALSVRTVMSHQVTNFHVLMQIDTGKIDEAVAAMLGNHVSMNVDNLYSALMAKTPKWVARGCRRC